MFPNFIQAGLWGIIGGLALFIGSIFAYYFNVPRKIIASAVAFSAGVLISAACFELMFESYLYGGFIPAIIGFFTGVVIFTIANVIISKRSIKYYENNKNNNNNNTNNNKTKEDYDKQNKEYLNKYDTQGLAVVVGSILDGIPESVAIGLTLIGGGPISMAMIIAVFISNISEGLSSSTSMKIYGWKKSSVFGLWLIITAMAGITAMIGYSVFSFLPPIILSTALSIAAGALLSMVADVLLPEAFEQTHAFTGLIMGSGFLLSFILSHL
ncbi:MAG: ZIP family metal transporter [Methanobacteriaceae archaeon]